MRRISKYACGLLCALCCIASAKPFAKGPYLGQTPPDSTPQVFAPGLICDTRPYQWESWPSFSIDGNTFCFNRQRYTYITVNTDQGWTTPQRLAMGNLRGHGPGIAPDKSFLVFYSVKPGASLGTETNLYLTLRRPDGSWTKPQDMGPRINSPYFEFAPRFSPDKKYMFFTRSTGWNLRQVCDTGDNYWVALKEYLPESYR